MADRCDPPRLEAACARALAAVDPSYRTIKGILAAGTGRGRLPAAWLAAIEADDQAGLRSLAAGIRNDQQAVVNGLTLHWNSGRGEGTVNKMIKRQMYGHAGFEMLRKRVILHPA